MKPGDMLDVWTLNGTTLRKQYVTVTEFSVRILTSNVSAVRTRRGAIYYVGGDHPTAFIEFEHAKAVLVRRLRDKAHHYHDLAQQCMEAYRAAQQLKEK